MKRERIRSLLAALLAVFMLAGFIPSAFADDPVYCDVHNYDELVQAIKANAEAPESIVADDLVYEEVYDEGNEISGGDVIDPEIPPDENGALIVNEAAWVGDEYFPPELYITLVPSEGSERVEIVFGEEGITIAKNQKVFISTDRDTVFYHGECDGPLFTVESGAELNIEYSGSDSFLFCAKNKDDDEWTEPYEEAFISSAGKLGLDGISFNDYNAVPVCVEGQNDFQAEAELKYCFFFPTEAAEIPFALKVGDFAAAKLENCEFHGYQDVASAIDGHAEDSDCTPFPPVVEEPVVEEPAEELEEVEEIEETVTEEQFEEQTQQFEEQTQQIEQQTQQIEQQTQQIEQQTQQIEQQTQQIEQQQTQQIEQQQTQQIEQQQTQQIEQQTQQIEQQQTQQVEQQQTQQIEQQTQQIEQPQTQQVEQPQTQQPEVQTQEDEKDLLDKLVDAILPKVREGLKEETPAAEQTEAEPVTEQPAAQPAAEQPVTQNIKVVSLWTDNQNYAGKRPDSTLVYLYKDGSVISTAKLTAADGWTYTFKDLQPGEYNISEQLIDSYTASYSTPENDRDNSILIMHYYSPSTSTTTYSASGASGTTGYQYTYSTPAPAYTAPAYTAPAGNASAYNYPGTSGAAAVTVTAPPRTTPSPTLAPAITPIPTVTPAPVTTDNTVITQASSRSNSHVGLWIALLGVSAVGCAAAILYYLKLQKRSRRNRRH